eukprot:242109_1
MAWTDYTDSLKTSGFTGACIVDRSSYAPLANFYDGKAGEATDCMPRAYKNGSDDVNENQDLMDAWAGKTGFRFNQLKFMVLRSEEDQLMGKKGPIHLYAFQLKTVWLIGLLDSERGKLSPGQANDAIGKMFDNLKAAGC